MTTIKVSSEVRDRLAAVAHAQHRTLGALLDEISRHLADEQLIADADQAMRRLQKENPEGWSDYRSELDAWEATVGDGLGDAAEEWPEYNTPDYHATIGTRR